MCFPVELMPGNGEVFEAIVLCRGQFKREWFQEDKHSAFKPYAVDHTGVYHTLKGAGLMQDEIFVTVIQMLNHLLAIDLI
jgi:hypothetical protein